MNDEDEEVQRQVGFFLYNLKKSHQELSGDIHTLILDYAGSRSMMYGGYNLGAVLWEQATDYPEWRFDTRGNKYLY
ncbi:hypothetical protein [Paenibacillus wynnii]|uniref:hypothetical protein n=1 Tax=Paenibacillus wynnii TaxID=268407 RepID=UPI0027D80602|nr:hypothetical protein [Paenibacillus wynnii]